MVIQIIKKSMKHSINSPIIKITQKISTIYKMAESIECEVWLLFFTDTLLIRKFTIQTNKVP